MSDRRPQRYERRIEELLATAETDGRVPLGSVVEVEVRHDPWCRASSLKGRCGCNPSIRLGAVKGQGPFPTCTVAGLIHLEKVC